MRWKWEARERRDEEAEAEREIIRGCTTEDGEGDTNHRKLESTQKSISPEIPEGQLH